MTRVSVYSSAFVAFAAAASMIIASIWMPHWVIYTVTTAKGDQIDKHLGLFRSCSSLDDPSCKQFPYQQLCGEDERYFCSMWRTTGFLAMFSLVLCLSGFVTFVLMLSGGKYRREKGWPIISGLLMVISIVEFAMISIVAYLYDNDDQFTIPGWHLDVSWHLATISAVLCLVASAGIAMSAYLLPSEEGYIFLDEPLEPGAA